MAHLAPARGNNGHAQPANPALEAASALPPPIRYTLDGPHERLMKSRG
jgi:hypothetical protein